MKKVGRRQEAGGRKKLGTGSNFYIQKPFTVDGLARKVREVLDK